MICLTYSYRSPDGQICFGNARLDYPAPDSREAVEALTKQFCSSDLFDEFFIVGWSVVHDPLSTVPVT